MVRALDLRITAGDAVHNCDVYIEVPTLNKRIKLQITEVNFDTDHLTGEYVTIKGWIPTPEMARLVALECETPIQSDPLPIVVVTKGDTLRLPTP